MYGMRRWDESWIRDNMLLGNLELLVFGVGVDGASL